MDTNTRHESGDARLYRQRFEALAQAHSVHVWRTGADGMFVEEQPAWTHYTGQTWEQFIAGNGMAMIHPDDRERVSETWHGAVERRTHYMCDFRLWNAATATFRLCTFRGVPILDERNQVLEWVGTFEDVEDQRRQQRELHESERRFRSILERVQAVGLMVDLQGRVIFANQYLLNITGRTAEEVIGRDYFDLFIDDASTDIRERFYKALAAGDIFPHAENEIVTTTGERRVIAWDNTVLRDSEGKLIGTASIGRDITEQVRSQRALRESEERLRLALSASRTGIWDVELATGKVTWTEECFSIFGITPEQFDGKADRFWERVHHDDVQRIRTAFEMSLARRVPYRQEFRIVRPDGELRWVVNYGRVVFDEGRPVRIVGSVYDITARKQAEESLRKAERFSAAGRMAAMVAHEINNPLAVVVNAIYLLRGHELPQSARLLLDMADAEIQRVVRISKQTLAFYKEKQTPAPLRAGDVVSEVVSSLNHAALKLGIELRAEINDHEYISGFADELRQVLLNAISNTFESGATRVIIRVRSSHRWISGRPGIRISVADNGRGIPQDKVRRLFEPFFTTKGEKGTGLGLWISKGIVQKHEGEIRIRTTTRPHRHGTCVALFFPSLQKAGSQAAGMDTGAFKVS